MKAYTDLEQSKKLAEILPLESADMCFNDNEPCWSLAALLSVFSLPKLELDEQEDGERGWIVSHYTDDYRYDSYYRDEPIDACYNLILKLHEQKLL